MTNKSYQTFESIGTVLWLIMDFIWMCDLYTFALLMFIPALVCLVTACIRYEDKRNSELLAMCATVCWLLMNAMWIMGELINKDACLLAAKFSFIIACLCTYLAFRIAKKEKSSTDFKRLKIK